MPPDWILFPRGRNLLAHRLDLERGAPIGAPVNTQEHPSTQSELSSTPPCAVSADGTMVYATRDRRTVDATWFDRGGHPLRTIPLGLPGIGSGTLSPDLARLAATADVDGPDEYVFDLVRGGSVALPGSDDATGQVAWSPDGSRVATGILGADEPLLVALDASGNGRADTLIAHSSSAKVPLTYVRDWTRDGATLVIGQSQPGSGWDILTKPAGDASPPVPYANTPAYEGDARVSHDGHWIAYVSNASGHFEINVDAFPRPMGARRLSFTGVSHGSGWNRLVWWREDDREIEYLGADGRTVYAAAIRTSPVLELGRPQPLFVAPPGTMGVEAAPDGQRFLVFQPHGPFANTFTVVLGARPGAGGK